MVKILNCYLCAKKNYGTLSKGAIFFFFGQPCSLDKSILLSRVSKALERSQKFPRPSLYIRMLVLVFQPTWLQYDL